MTCSPRGRGQLLTLYLSMVGVRKGVAPESALKRYKVHDVQLD